MSSLAMLLLLFNNSMMQRSGGLMPTKRQQAPHRVARCRCPEVNGKHLVVEKPNKGYQWQGETNRKSTIRQKSKAAHTLRKQSPKTSKEAKKFQYDEIYYRVLRHNHQPNLQLIVVLLTSPQPKYEPHRPEKDSSSMTNQTLENQTGLSPINNCPTEQGNFSWTRKSQCVHRTNTSRLQHQDSKHNSFYQEMEQETERTQLERNT